MKDKVWRYITLEDAATAYVTEDMKEFYRDRLRLKDVELSDVQIEIMKIILARDEEPQLDLQLEVVDGEALKKTEAYRHIKVSEEKFLDLPDEFGGLDFDLKTWAEEMRLINEMDDEEE